MWRLVTSPFFDHRWRTFTFKKCRSERQITIYYHQFDPTLTHVGIVAQRRGEAKLNDLCRLVDAFEQLTGDAVGFRCRDDQIEEGVTPTCSWAQA